MATPAQLAAARIEQYSQARAVVTAPGYTNPEDVEPVKFDRLGLERRVLAFISPGETELGPRNTLHALTYDLMRDACTTHPPETHGRLEVNGSTVEEVAQRVQDCLDALEAEKLVRSADGTYSVTKAGSAELGR